MITLFSDSSGSAIYLFHPSSSSDVDESKPLKAIPAPHPDSGLYIIPRSRSKTSPVKVAIPPNCLAFQTGEALQLCTGESLSLLLFSLFRPCGRSDFLASSATLIFSLRWSTSSNSPFRPGWKLEDGEECGGGRRSCWDCYEGDLRLLPPTGCWSRRRKGSLRSRRDFRAVQQEDHGGALLRRGNDCSFPLLFDFVHD